MKIQNAFLESKNIVVNDKKNNSEQNPRRKTSIEYLEKKRQSRFTRQAGDSDAGNKDEGSSDARGSDISVTASTTQKSTININDLIVPVRRPTPKRRHTF